MTDKAVLPATGEGVAVDHVVQPDGTTVDYPVSKIGTGTAGVDAGVVSSNNPLPVEASAEIQLLTEIRDLLARGVELLENLNEVLP